jgi:hypothetical protein
MKVFQSALLIGLAVLLLAGSSFALDVSIEPNVAQRAIEGQVRVHIFATSAVDLISFGLTVTYDENVLEVVEASKYEDLTNGWVMDADGLPGSVPDDQHTDPPVDTSTPGIVKMIGGRLTGTATAGLNGKVLLGWIVFKGKSGVTGTSDISIDLANPAPYDNFVGISTTPAPVYDGDITPGQRATICIRDASSAREGDIDGDGNVFYSDYAVLSAAWNSQFGDANYNPAADLDGDGIVFYSDYALLSADWNQAVTPCP